MEEKESLFEDLLDDNRISRLEIREPDLSSFDVHAVVDVLTESKPPAEDVPRKRFSRKARKQEEEQNPQAAIQKRSLKRAERSRQTEEEQVPAEMSVRESSAAWKLTDPETSDPLFISQQAEEKKEPEPIEPEVQVSEDLIALRNDLKAREVQRTEKLVEKAEDYISEVSSENAARTQILELNPPVIENPENIEAIAAAADLKETIEEEEDIFRNFHEPDVVDEDLPVDPDSSLVDDTDYDLYVDRKRFWVSDYERVQEYLGRQAAQGFEYVKHEGKRFYFHKIKPTSYYYQMLYFVDEPEQDQWDAWQRDGWELVGQDTGRKKRDAGWYTVRNEEKLGEYRKVIENEEEKVKFYRKSAASYRSSMFLFFIVMICCAISLFLQIEFRGYLAGMILSGVLFFLALIFFSFYGVMRRKALRSARMLRARIRVKDKDPLQEEIDDMTPEGETVQLEGESA